MTDRDTRKDKVMIEEIDNIMRGLFTERKSCDLYTVGIDGGDCLTVGELAAVNQCSELKAATWAVKNVGGPLRHDAVEYIKALRPSPETNQTGVILCLVPDWSSRVQLANFDGDAPGELHLTLYYAGDLKDGVSESVLLKLEDIGRKTAARWSHGPIEAKANGLTRFSGEDSDACVVNIDSPALPKLYAAIMGQIALSGLPFREPDHGFTPHVTIGYLNPEDPLPLDRWNPHSVYFRTLEMWVGNEVTTWTLGAPEPESDAEAVKPDVAVMVRPGEVSPVGEDQVPAIAATSVEFKQISDRAGALLPKRV